MFRKLTLYTLINNNHKFKLFRYYCQSNKIQKLSSLNGVKTNILNKEKIQSTIIDNDKLTMKKNKDDEEEEEEDLLILFLILPAAAPGIAYFIICVIDAF